MLGLGLCLPHTEQRILLAEEGIHLVFVFEIEQNGSVDFHQREVWEPVLYFLWRIALQPGRDDAVDFHAAVADVPVVVAVVRVLRCPHRIAPFWPGSVDPGPLQYTVWCGSSGYDGA